MTTSLPVKSYYASRTKMLLLLVGCVVFTIGMVWILIDPSDASPRVQLASWVGVPSLGFISLYLVFRLIRWKPSVVLDTKGLRDDASIFSAGFIPWDEIKAVEVYTVVSNRMVGIVLKDNEKFLARLGPVRRALSRTFQDKESRLVAIPEDAVSVNADELAKEIKSRLDANATPESIAGSK